MKTELPTLPLPDVDAHTSERTAVNATTVEALGHMALIGERQPDEDYIATGINQLEAFANGTHPTEAQAGTGSETNAAAEADTRVHDIEAAHEAALRENAIFDVYDEAQRENEIFDAHVAALKENELFDAHEAALKEDAERSKAKAQQQEQPTPTDTAKSEKASSPLETSSPDELRQEAAVALKEAGLSGLAANISLDSQVSKGLDGSLVIANGNSATVITRQLGSAPRVTEYAYDRDNGTLTVSEGGIKAITGRVVAYEATQDKQWQTRDEIITLPPALASRFGIERAVVLK